MTSTERKDPVKVISDYVETLRKDAIIAKEKYFEAQPVYYGIMTTEDVITEKGYGDFYKFYDRDEWSGSGMTPREAFAMCWEYEYIDESNAPDFVSSGEDITYEMIKQADGQLPESVDDDEIAEYLRENMEEFVVCFEMKKMSRIAENAMFLTEAEAKKHFELNDYHYSPDAHIFCMTAWRNPAFGEFLDVIKNVDFEKSTIVMREDAEYANPGQW